MYTRLKIRFHEIHVRLCSFEKKYKYIACQHIAHTHTHIHTPSHPRSEPCPFSLESLHVSQVLKEIDSEGISVGTLNIS